MALLPPENKVSVSWPENLGVSGERGLRILLTLLICVAIYCLGVGLYVLWSVHLAKAEILTDTDRSLLLAARSLKHMLASDFQDRAVDENSIPFDEVERNRIAVSTFALEADFKYAYTLVERGGKFFFSAPSVTEEERKERASWYFYPYEDIPPEFTEAFRTGKPVFVEYKDQWGSFRSVALPEKSPNGRTYLACADREISDMDSQLRGHITRSFLTAFGFLLLSIPFLILFRMITGELKGANRVLLRQRTDLVRLSEERAHLAAAMEQAAESVLLFDRDLIVRFVNKATVGHFSHASNDILGLRMEELLQETGGERYGDIILALSTGSPWYGRFTHARDDGVAVTLDSSITPMLDDTGQIQGYVLIGRDITEEIELEKRLRQSQKLEAIGTLAGGIAHDFNNVLSPMIAYTEMMLSYMPETCREYDYLERVLEAGIRASELVKQILTFSRQVEQTHRPVLLQPILKETQKLMRASIPSTIRMETRLDEHAGRVMGDAVQIHQVLMNLMTNAYHAMKENGGVLSVSLASCTVEQDMPPLGTSLAPGEYICLKVSDTGCGIDETTRESMFMPFFTTKPVGEGTGLGLATVHGIVMEYGGEITVESTVGEGSTFSVYLPVVPEIDVVVEAVSVADYRGTARVLAVDDEVIITDLLTDILSNIGYTVTRENNSLRALERLCSNTEEFDVLITDLTMPGLTGDILAMQVLKVKPGFPIVLMTGSEQTFSREDAEKLGVLRYVTKPLTPQKVAEAVYESVAFARPPKV